MSLWVMISNLVIGPLKLIFEIIYAIAARFLTPGFSIVVLSLSVNLLVLPLYRRADIIQNEARDIEARLAPGIQHIKDTFQGDEQFFMLQSFYRRNHYSPVQKLKSALPLILQIPFFIAAYHFLSSLGDIRGVSFGYIQDLSKPDSLIRLGSLTLNLLPLLMTAINILSGVLYTKGAPLKEKLQTWILALFFLVWLYDSPAGLTFYWMLNNLFSLGKNIIQKVLSPRKKREKQLPAILRKKPHPNFFFLCCAVLAILTGFLIPSAVLASSPQDFVSYVTAPNPVWYVVNASLLSAGTFVLWAGIYYLLGSSAVKKGMEYGVWVLAGVFLVNYLFFRNNLGTISSNLKYDLNPAFTVPQKLVNLVILLIVAFIFLLLMIKKETIIRAAAWTMILAMSIMAGRNLWVSESEVSRAVDVRNRNYSGLTEIPLSREGQNVIVLMLDRAVSSYLPCILYERPDLKDVYSGFTYYPNTLSFGAHTNFGAPALFGGYEYTPKAINARDTVLLKDKQNEALLLMPTLFSQQGYKISIFDVPYPGDYTISGDYSVFDSLPDTNARVLSGAAELGGIWEKSENLKMRNFFCYSMSMVVPSVFFGTVYDWGNYNQADKTESLFSLNKHVSDDESAEMNYYMMEFIADYNVLCSLKEITNVQAEKPGTLLIMNNKTAHAQVTLPEPEYAPLQKEEDNTAYDAEHADRFLAGPLPLKAETENQMQHYETNMAALLQVGEWLKYLKEMNVYDNTRIIIVSDHGAIHLQIEQGVLETNVESVGFNGYGTIEDVMSYNPLLLVKDFNASGEIQTDTTFMTNADVPSIAMEGVISDPVNPFTGNAINTQAKAEPCYVTFSHLSDVGRDKGTTFDPAYWFSVSPGGETLFDPTRWTVVPELQ